MDFKIFYVLIVEIKLMPFQMTQIRQLSAPKETPKKDKNEETNYQDLLGEDMAFAGPGIAKLVTSVITEWAEKELIPRFNRLDSQTATSALDLAKEKLSIKYKDFENNTLEVQTLLEDYPHKRGTLVSHLERLYKMVKADKEEAIVSSKRIEKIKKNAENDPQLGPTDLEDAKVTSIDQEPETVEDAVRLAWSKIVG